MGDLLSRLTIVEFYPVVLLLAGIAAAGYLWLKKHRGHFSLVVGPRAWALGWTDFLILIWLLFSWMLVASGLTERFFPDGIGTGGDSEIWSIVVESFIAQAGTAILFLVYRQFQPFDVRSPINSKELSIAGAVGFGFVLFLAATPFVILGSLIWLQVLELVRSLGLDLPVDRQELVGFFSDAESPWAFLSLLLLATVVAPIAEELVFRAGIYRFFKSRFTRGTAMMASALLFAVLHMNLLILPSLILLGVFLCMAYELTGNIRTSIALHAWFNLNTVVLIVLQDLQ